MKHLLILFLLILLLATPVYGADFSPPPAPDEAIAYLPDETENFSQGLLFVIGKAIEKVKPELTEGLRICVSLIAVALSVGILRCFSQTVSPAVSIGGCTVVSLILLQPTKALIHLGGQSVVQISQYGKLLLPVMTGAMAAQGAVTKSAALYTATTFFDMLLCTCVEKLLLPLVYIFICVAVVSRIFPGQILEELRKFLKWLMTWGLKTLLYVFTGYIGITGIVAGNTDAALLKATKLTISGMVPVVGGILSDASEAVLVSAGLVRNSVGVYGLLTVTALWIGPFLEIGVQYLCVKLTGGICRMFCPKPMADIMGDYSETMGLLLAMTGAMCLIVLISTVCFMKGVA